MRLILALVIFGLMGAIAAYGFITSQKALRERQRHGSTEDHPMAGVAGNNH